MVLPTTLRFARVARALTTEARRLGLEAPGFRSPPGLPESDRTIRRAHWGTVVAVRLRGRPFEAVAKDMVEGVVRANALDDEAAARLRERLYRIVLDVVSDAEEEAERSERADVRRKEVVPEAA